MDVGLHEAAVLTVPERVGPYRLICQIGAGAMGRVFRARDTRSGEIVAIKTLSQVGPLELLDIKREFRVARDLSSPYLAPIYDLFAEQGVGFIVMPLIEGATLDAWVRTVDLGASAGRLAGVLTRVLSGLLDLHRAGLVHRDIKPSNIMVKADDTVVIVDFGIAAKRAVPHTAGYGSRSFAGTLDYAAPEALLDPEPRAAHDMFAFGVTAFELLTGRLPPRLACSWEVDVRDTRQVVHAACAELSVPLTDVILGALENDPARRLSAAGALSRLAPSHDGEPGEREARAERLVGRNAELREACQSLAHAGCRLGVLGPSGIGKTTLVNHALSTLAGERDERLLLLAGRCHPGENLPYRLLDEAIDQLCSWLKGRRELLAALDISDLSLLCSAFPVLGQLPGQAAERRKPPTSSADSRLQLGRALASVLARIAEERTVVLWIDDVHWADDDGVQLLSEALALPHSQSLRVVLSGREVPDKLAARLHTELSLRPLEPACLRRLAVLRAQRFKPDFCERDLVPWQIDAAAGNPGLVCQLAEFLATARTPCASLKEVVAERFRELPNAAVEVARAMSLLGRPMPASVAHALAHAPSGREVMLKLSRIGLVRTSPALGHDGFVLAHDSLREAILGQLVSDARPALHARLAQALAGLPAAPSELLATHWQGAGDSEQARRLFRLGGRTALAGLAFAHAAHCFERASALSSTAASVDELAELGEAHSLAGHASEAAQCFGSCARMLPSHARTDFLRRSATHYFLVGDNERAIAIVNDLLAPVHGRLPTSTVGLGLRLLLQRALAPRLSAATSCRGPVRERDADIADLAYDVTTGLSHADLALGAYVQALHLRHGMRSACPVRSARALALEAGYRSTSAAPDSEVRGLLERARKLLGGRDEPRVRALFLLAEGGSAWSRGRFSECIEHAREAERIAERDCVGAWWELGFARSILQDALRWSGRYRELAPLTARYLADARSRSDRFASVTFETRFSATLHLVGDRPELAWTACDAAGNWPSRGVHLQHLAEFHSRTECLLYRGQDEAALSRALSDSRRMLRAPLLWSAPPRTKLLHQLAACRLARAAHSVGRTRGVLLRAARREARRVRAAGWPYAVLLAEVLEATAAALEGHDVRPRLRALREAAQRLDMRQYAAALGLAAATEACDRSEHEHALAELGVRDPARFAGMLLPGLITRTS